MENVTETNTGQESNPAGTPARSVGAMLREAREHLGLSVIDISGQIKFAPRQIEALEADDFQHLPEEAFLRGFVRSYAKVLNLDAQTLFAALPQKKAPAAELPEQPVKERFPAAHSALRQNLVWLGGALVLILIVAGLGLWQFTKPSTPKSSQVESPVTLPAETPASSVLPITVAESAKTELPKAQPPKVQTQKAQLPKQPPKVQPSATAAQSAVSAGQSSSVQAASAVAAQPSKPSPVASLRLEFSEDGWAEIKDKDGKILSSRAHSAGSELRVSGHPPFSVLIGHALSVRLYFRDKEIDLVPHTRRSTEVASLKLE